MLIRIVLTNFFFKFFKIIENAIKIHAPIKKAFMKAAQTSSLILDYKKLLSTIPQKRKSYSSDYLNSDQTTKQIFKNFANKLNEAKT